MKKKSLTDSACGIYSYEKLGGLLTVNTHYNSALLMLRFKISHALYKENPQSTFADLHILLA